MRNSFSRWDLPRKRPTIGHTLCKSLSSCRRSLPTGTHQVNGGGGMLDSSDWRLLKRPKRPLRPRLRRACVSDVAIILYIVFGCGIPGAIGRSECSPLVHVAVSEDPSMICSREFVVLSLPCRQSRVCLRTFVRQLPESSGEETSCPHAAVPEKVDGREVARNGCAVLRRDWRSRPTCRRRVRSDVTECMAV